MAGGRRILITGIGNQWGTELARRLERHDDVEQVIGIDGTLPDADLEQTELLEADIRSPVLARLIPTTRADTVVHTGILWYPEPGKPARALHDINVIGTLQLLAACERSPTVERIILRGSAAIYGCEAAGPSFFSEEMARTFPLRTRFQRDIGELEEYFENFARRHPGIRCCMLRYQPEIGPGLNTPLTRYLSLPVVPTQLGFDPRLQLIHAEDATGALQAAAMNPVRGAVNVAPSGSVSLSRALRLAGRTQLPLPHQLFGPAMSRLGSHLGAGTLYGDGVRMLRYGRGVDNRRMREELGFTPRFDATGAIRDFARTEGGMRLAPVPGVASVLEYLGGTR
ncbi:MAG: NAD-dependent epimerase/dehydratase family protein [Solirubrobacterales bacterium]|nr:NAD-dependent epimerase/dehydratase family protein [Solirubrobacterales bacterium]